MVAQIKYQCAKTKVSQRNAFLIPTERRLNSILHSSSNRYRLNSASDEDEDDEDVPTYDDYAEHLQYMAERDRLQEFPGRIPPRKKKDVANGKVQPRKARVSTVWLE